MECRDTLDLCSVLAQWVPAPALARLQLYYIVPTYLDTLYKLKVHYTLKLNPIHPVLSTVPDADLTSIYINYYIIEPNTSMIV